jgi:hypothetical protein
MAIAHDSSAAGMASGTVTSLTFAHTCSGNNRIMLVGWAFIDGNSRTLSSITYNGDASTGDVYAPYTPSGFRYNGLVYFTAPDAGGSYNVVITASGAVSNNILGASISYTGVDQTNPINTKDETYVNPGSTVTATMTTTVNNCWLAGTGLCNDSGTFSAGTDTTMRTKSSYGNSWIAGFDSNSARSTGSNSIQCQYQANTALNFMVAALAPAVAGGGTVTPSGSLGLLGCGM